MEIIPCCCRTWVWYLESSPWGATASKIHIFSLEYLTLRLLILCTYLGPLVFSFYTLPVLHVSSYQPLFEPLIVPQAQLLKESDYLFLWDTSSGPLTWLLVCQVVCILNHRIPNISFKFGKNTPNCFSMTWKKSKQKLNFIYFLYSSKRNLRQWKSKQKNISRISILKENGNTIEWGLLQSDYLIYIIKA